MPHFANLKPAKENVEITRTSFEIPPIIMFLDLSEPSEEEEDVAFTNTMVLQMTLRSV